MKDPYLEDVIYAINSTCEHGKKYRMRFLRTLLWSGRALLALHHLLEQRETLSVENDGPLQLLFAEAEELVDSAKGTIVDREVLRKGYEFGGRMV